MAEPAPARRLLNATAVMASGTMVSRILGLVRAMMIAFVLGNGTLRVETFTFAQTVPNSLYMLLAGGTLNNVLVPQIVRAILHDKDAGKAFVNRIMTAFLLALGALTVLLTLAVPWVMSLYTDAGWRTEAMAEQWQSLLLMSYITMPQLFFYGVFFLIGQVLNAREVFGPMMWAPIVNNVVAIAVFGAYIAIWGTNASAGEPFTVGQVVLLGAGSTLGIIIQTLVLLPYLKKAGFSYRPRFDLKGTGLGRTFHLAKWMVGYVALTSLAQVVVSRLASSAAPYNPVTNTSGGAGFAAYQSAYLIWILPHSLLTVSLATAMLPSASRAAAAGDRRGVTDETTRALRLATTFLVPASLGLFALADPISRVIYGHGAGATDYQFVAWALMAFAIGLVPYSIQYLYLRAFYALDNTKTPFLLQLAISGANAALAIVLVFAFAQPSTVAALLALAYSLAYFLGCYLTHRALSRRIPGLSGRDTVRHLVRLLVASIPAAMLAFGIGYLGSQFDSLLWRVVALVAAAGLAVVAYFYTAKRMRIPEASELMSVLRRRPASADDGESPLVADELAAADQSADRRPDATDDPDDPGQLVPLPDTDPPGDDPDGVGVFVPVDPADPPEAVLDYPPPVPVEADEFDNEPTNLIDIGRMLAGRYQLSELLAERNGHKTWLAEDTVLTRPVLLHLLSEDDPRADEVLELARRAALATDSRFLRVLDVVRASHCEHGVYLVYEYATGQTLQRVLAGGPLTGAETAWVVREVSDALVGLHANGLHHRHLSPATVLITTSGNVKIIGLLVDEVLSGVGHSPLDGETEDVLALGRLLYASLVARWPGEAGYGLPGVPLDHGRLPLPSQVRSGVAHPVDVVVDRILSPQPRQHASRLTTAADVTTELSLVLGPTSAAADLRVRLDRADPGAPPVSSVAPPVPTPARPRFEVSESVPEFGPDYQPWSAPSASEPTPAPFTPVPPPSTPSEAPTTGAPAGRRRLVWLILALVVVISIVWAVLARGGQQAGEQVQPTPDPPAAVAIRKATDFDPRKDGGSAQENPRQAARVIDADPATAWRTERYRKLPTLGGLKPGVGLVLDLGSPVEIRRVSLLVDGGPTAFEIRVPAETAEGDPPMDSQEQWRTVAKAEAGPGEVPVDFAPVTTRHVLVYLTKLPPAEDGYFRGAIAEAEVLK